MENTDKKGKKRWLLLVLLLLLLLLLGVLFCRKKPQTADTAPAPESSVSTPAGGGTVSLTYSDAAGIDLTAGQVTQLPLLDGAEKDLTAGSCSGTLKVSFYHPQTGAKAMLDAEIPVTVTVTG